MVLLKQHYTESMMITGEPYEATTATQEQVTAPADTQGTLGEVALRGPENYKVESWRRYLEYVQEATEGPQREGLYFDDKDKVLGDPRTVCINIRADGTEMLWPLMTLITNNDEYAPGYFDRMEGSDNTYYISLPPARLLESSEDQAAVGHALLGHMENGSLLVYDELVGQHKDKQIQEYISHMSDAVIEVDGFVDPKNNSEAAIRYYSAPIILRDEQGEPLASQAPNMWQAYDLLVERGEITNTRMIDADSDGEAIDGLWNIYQRQFKALVENFPRKSLRTEEQFRAMLADSAMYTVAHFERDERGVEVPVAFATFVTDVEHCAWLHTDYFDTTFPNENILYISSIASDPSRRGQVYSANILRLFEQLSTTIGLDYRVAFLCSNISADYIPRRIVERGIRDSVAVTTPVTEIGSYNYRGIRLTEYPVVHFLRMCT